VRERLPTPARATSHDQIETFLLAAPPNLVAKLVAWVGKRVWFAGTKSSGNFRLTWTHGRGGVASALRA
jgi:hypothetical protein